MAPTATETDTETTEEGGLRSQMWKHEAMVEWLNATEEIDLDEMSAAEIIAFAFAKRVAWRNSDTYQNLVANHKADSAKDAEAKKAAADEKAAAKKAEKAAAAEAAAAAKAEVPAEDKAAAKPAGKAAAKATKTPTKATRAAKRTTKASAVEDGEDPFS